MKYSERRNNVSGYEYSSKLSPWLANGCLSIRQLYHETKECEIKFGASRSTRKFIFELIWRDFFRYWCLYNGNSVFYEYGIHDRKFIHWKSDFETIDRWK